MSEVKKPRTVVEEALQLAWNDYCNDTGNIPDAFRIHGPASTQVSARFADTTFGRYVHGWIGGLGFSVTQTLEPLNSADADRIEAIANGNEYVWLSPDDRELLRSHVRNLRAAAP